MLQSMFVQDKLLSNTISKARYLNLLPNVLSVPVAYCVICIYYLSVLSADPILLARHQRRLIGVRFMVHNQGTTHCLAMKWKMRMKLNDVIKQLEKKNFKKTDKKLSTLSVEDYLADENAARPYTDDPITPSKEKSVPDSRCLNQGLLDYNFWLFGARFFISNKIMCCVMYCITAQ